MAIFKTCAAVVIAGAVSLFAAGCYEELNPQPQQQSSGSAEQPGPITSYGMQGGGSALGAAKRSATNIVGQAQQHSEDVARQADEP